VAACLFAILLMRRSFERHAGEVAASFQEKELRERALRESEGRLRGLIQDLNVGVLLLGREAEVLWSNSAALEMLGVTAPELLGKSMRDPSWDVVREDGSAFPGPPNMAHLPGDGDFGNPGTADPDFVEPDNWTRVKSLLSTLSDAELADPDLSAERVLFRLYHETGVRVFEPIVLEERCTCSVERIEAMLQDSFTAEERQDMAVDGEIEVVCEFCSTAYHFNPHQFDDTEHTSH